MTKYIAIFLSKVCNNIPLHTSKLRIMIKEFSQKYQLTAGECTPQREMSLPVLMNRIIEIATFHANSWGAGYERLIADNQAWVLSRVTIEMETYPKVNEEYVMTTWIEDYNRHFSLRNMVITSVDGKTMGYVRTMWLVIDLATRASVDISKLSYIVENVSPRPCPIEPQERMRAMTPTRTLEHTFGSVECDVNRHVNTVRYLELMLNQFPLEKFDNQLLYRTELAFVKETRYAETVTVNIDDSDPEKCGISLDNESGCHCRGLFKFKPRENT